jgi:DNA (cytosine-5)-methyltransferase 1
MPDHEALKSGGLSGLRFIDLFAGIGGFHLAMESHGMECVFASEWDRHAARVYENNFGMKPRGDITKIAEAEVPEHDVLCGGFPCQAFSISGKRLGFAEARGTLFFELARIAKERQPKVLFLENVRNFAQHDGGRTLATVLAALDEIGYTTFHQVINAAELGFPTARRRIYMVAFRKDLGLDPVSGFSFPSPAPLSARQPLKRFLQSRKDALDQVETLEGVRLHPKKSDPKAVERRLKRRPNSPVRIGVVGRGGQGERVYSAEGPAITFSAYGGGIASKTGAYWVGGVARKLTPRECANVMGFPKTFKITQRPQQAYKQFGNSVVVGLLKLIGRQIDIALRRAAGEDVSALEAEGVAAFEAAIAPGLNAPGEAVENGPAVSPSLASETAGEAKRPRGRPRKAPAPEEAEPAPKRPRGRPRKNPLPAEAAAPQAKE